MYLLYICVCLFVKLLEKLKKKFNIFMYLYKKIKFIFINCIRNSHLLYNVICTRHLMKDEFLK